MFHSKSMARKRRHWVREIVIELHPIAEIDRSILSSMGKNSQNSSQFQLRKWLSDKLAKSSIMRFFIYVVDSLQKSCSSNEKRQ